MLSDARPCGPTRSHVFISCGPLRAGALATPLASRRVGRTTRSAFFEDAWLGTSCSRNWYTGNRGTLGTIGPASNQSREHYTAAAPALLGFDESIDDYCFRHGGKNPGGASGHAIACVRANINILSLYGRRIPYNTCRNIEWQICAALGRLPGQGSNAIRFAKAPGSLQPNDGPHPIGSCSGYAPLGCWNGYASSDIFFLESCFYSMMCRNRKQLFSMPVGEDWSCEPDRPGFERMRDMILRRKPQRAAHRS